MRPPLGAAATAAIVGAVVAVFAFGVTSVHRNVTYLGGVCWEYTSYPSIDPWSGEWVAGEYVDHSDRTPPFGCSAEAGLAFALEPPPDLAEIRAIPLQVGFTLGSTAALVAIVFWRVTKTLPYPLPHRSK